MRLFIRIDKRLLPATVNALPVHVGDNDFNIPVHGLWYVDIPEEDATMYRLQGINIYPVSSHRGDIDLVEGRAHLFK